MIAAYRQVDRRLATFPGSWSESPTWLLYIIYVFVPLVLFWLLDRTGAINDTSVVAAAVVGIGYEHILSGQAEAQVPSALTGFWKPFVVFADSISARVTKRIGVRVSRFHRSLIEKISGSDESFNRLRNLARSLTRDITSLDKKIEELETKRTALGDLLTREKQVKVYYSEIAQEPGWIDLLRDATIIDESAYKSYPSDKGFFSRGFEICIPLLIILIFLASSKSVDQEYHLWRLAKSNATVTDQWRTREALITYITNPATTITMSKRIARLARGPAMHPGRIEIALQALIAGAKRANLIPLVASEIVGALRAQSVDNRTRLHSALFHLAKVQTGNNPSITTLQTTLPKDLYEWKPTDGDSIVDIEERIDSWSAFWARFLLPTGVDNTTPNVKK